MDKNEALRQLGLPAEDDNESSPPPIPGSKKTALVDVSEEDIGKLARESTPRAFQTIVEISQDVDIHPKIRLAAAKEILDRGIGKSVQQTSVTVSHDDTVKQLQQAFIGKYTEAEVVED